MSMIGEQVKGLKEEAKWLEKDQEKRLASILRQAADNIEALSAKLASVNGGEWVACEDRLPNDTKDVLVFYKARIDGGTHDGEEIYNFGIGCYFSHSNKWSIVTLVKTKENTQKVIAWQPLPEPYRP